VCSKNCVQWWRDFSRATTSANMRASSFKVSSPITLLFALWGFCSARSCSKGAADGSCPDVTQEDFLLQAKFQVHTDVSTSVDEGEDGPKEQKEEKVWKAYAEHWAHTHKHVQHAGDWMYETSLHNAQLAGGDPSDADYARLSAVEKKAFFKQARDASNKILQEGGEEAAHAKKIFVDKFKTEHKKALHALKHKSYMADVGQQPCNRYEGAGGISGLYTFGAPGTTLVPLNNVLREDGKFPGLRLVTQKVTKFGKFIRTYHDPVPFVAGIIGMQHPHMDLLVLPGGSEGLEPLFHETSLEVVNKPRSDLSFWVGGHFQTVYYKELKPHNERFDPKAWTMLHMSRAVSPSDNNNTMAGNAAVAAMVGWNLVAQSKNEKLSNSDIIYRDNTSLYQDPVTKACAISFVGTHHITQWMVNLRFNLGMFCGIPNVHIGFRNQVRRVILSQQWNEEVLPALASCPKLYITGHSLGGAQAQLVAACLQRAPAEGEAGWEDYKHLVWTPKAEAEALPSLVSAEDLSTMSVTLPL